MQKKHREWKRLLALVLAVGMVFGIFYSVQTIQAGQYTLSVTQAKSMALANSDSYRRIKSKISLKEVSYKQAVKSIQLKIKNKTTFRWSPLLSFTFPEKLNFEDESSMVYKPAQIQNEITTLKHDLTDEVYNVYESTEQAFLKVYTYQEKVAFEEEQVEELQKTLEKNKGRLLLGLANKADIEKIEKNLCSAEEKLAQDKKSFENAKTKLGDLIAMDVSTRYTFSNPYVSAEIPRSELESFIAYTLENDHSYYEAKMNTQLSFLQLDSNFSLLKGQYGSKIDLISTYVQMIKNGQEIDNNAFKASYDKFLKKIDDPWTGKKKILFINVPKEWFKGEIDGVRYIEDEPYVLYENALEYQDALAEQQALEKELTAQVRDSFEAIVTAQNSYQKLKEQVAESKAQLQKEQILNVMGELSFEEYTESLSQYQSQQIEALEALELYSSLLYSFDRLTCGAVSKYLDNAEISLEGGAGGNSFIVDEEAIQGARYYIQSIVEDNMFEFGVYLPEDFQTDITHFELWTDDYCIGEKTAIDKTLRHLTLSLTGNEKVFVRLYNDEEFVGDCEIDPTAYQGPLDIKGYVVKEKEEAKKKVIGSYEVNRKDEMGIVEITLQIDSSENISYYAIQNENGANLMAKDKIEIKEDFMYLDFLSNDLESLKILLYEKDSETAITAYFNPQKYEVYQIEE